MKPSPSLRFHNPYWCFIPVTSPFSSLGSIHQTRPTYQNPLGHFLKTQNTYFWSHLQRFWFSRPRIRAINLYFLNRWFLTSPVNPGICIEDFVLLVCLLCRYPISQLCDVPEGKVYSPVRVQQNCWSFLYPDPVSAAWGLHELLINLSWFIMIL